MIEPLYVPSEQYNNLLFIIYNIYDLLFIRLVITHN